MGGTGVKWLWYGALPSCVENVACWGKSPACQSNEICESCSRRNRPQKSEGGSLAHNWTYHPFTPACHCPES